MTDPRPIEPLDVDGPGDVVEIIFAWTTDVPEDVQAIALNPTRLQRSVDLRKYPEIAERARDRVPESASLRLHPQTQEVVSPPPVIGSREELEYE